MPYFAPAAPLMGTSTTLFRGIIDLNTTVDQALNKMLDFGAYVIDRIVVAKPSKVITTAKGGFYTQTSKSGVPVINSTQSYAGLSGTTAVINPAVSLDGTGIITDPTLYVSLTTPEGSAATAEVFVMGVAGN